MALFALGGAGVEGGAGQDAVARLPGGVLRTPYPGLRDAGLAPLQRRQPPGGLKLKLKALSRVVGEPPTGALAQTDRRISSRNFWETHSRLFCDILEWFGECSFARVLGVSRRTFEVFLRNFATL